MKSTEQVGVRLTGGLLPVNNIFEMEWPPPDEVTAFSHPVYTGGQTAIVVAEPEEGFPEGSTIARYRKVKQSKLTDEQVAEVSVLVRGAEYEPVLPPDQGSA